MTMTRESLNTMIKERMQNILSDTQTLKGDFEMTYTNWFQNLVKSAKQRRVTEKLEQQAQGDNNAA